MEWNYNGSLIACTSKDQNFYICDPRNGEITLKNKGHESPKTMKMTWIDEFTLLTTGFSLVMKYPHADAKAPTPPKPKARKDPSPNLISSVGSFF